MSEAETQSDEAIPASRSRWRVIALLSVVVVLLVTFLLVRSLSPRGPENGVRIADVSSERLTALGSVVGFAAAHETHAWIGLPFALPPVGPLRWRAPRAPEPWSETRDALEFGAPCPQLSSALGGVPSDEEGGFAGQEDCLYLNVWSPRFEPDAVPSGDARLPVMLWIHGGGNRTGYAGSSMYDGARLAGTGRVIVVTVNYRLGPFGWFSHPALRAEAESTLEASGNFATLDQIRALEWVQEHIEEFGGDPDNVTIFGESAGGTNVLALLLAEPARGLFHRAIAQSGSTDSVSRAEAENPLDAPLPGHPHSSAETVVSLLEQAGVVPDRAAAARYAADLPDVDLLAFLRGRSDREILDAYRRPERPSDIDVPRLIRDGALLPEGDWLLTLQAGRHARVPVLLGSNRDEMKLFFSQDETYVSKRFGLLYRIRDPEDYERRARYHSDLWALRSVVQPASALVESGLSEVYAYRFDWDGLPRLLGADLAQLLGAAHGFEIPFVFGNFDLGDPLFSRLLFVPETELDRERLVARVMSYWTEFARTGRPDRGGREDLPEWLPWSDAGLARANLMLIDDESGGGVRLSQSSLSRDRLIAAVDAEPDLAQREKCALFLDLFRKRPGWNADEYRRIGLRGCADYPPESIE